MLYSKEKLEHLQKRWETKNGQKLVQTIKETRCFLNPELFREHIKRLACINDEEVRDKVDLRGINLEGYDFRPHIKKNSHFIYGKAILEDIHFEGANLQYAQFSSGQINRCHFEDSDITQAKFKNAIITDSNFEKVGFHNVNMRNAKLIRCNFNDCTFRDTVLTEANVDEKTHFGNILLDEIDGNYQIATIQYRQLKEIYKNSSLFKQADHYHYREMVCKRKRLKWHNPAKWVDYILGDLLCKYGDSLGRLVSWTIALILGFALVYSFDGIQHFETKIHGDFFDSLYFSLTTYTTLGPGDWLPREGFRMITAIEAVVGAAGIALFTVILARKIIRD